MSVNNCACRAEFIFPIFLVAIPLAISGVMSCVTLDIVNALASDPSGDPFALLAVKKSGKIVVAGTGTSNFATGLPKTA